MARPIKNNCDYFPHDRDMRDHKKVKAIRSKFGPVGYAIWVMTLEYLTGSDGNVFEYSDLELELMAGSFGVSATEIRDVIDYCVKLELLFNKNGWINSESLDERLAPVFEKRGKAKELSRKQHRSSGKYVAEMPQKPVVSVTEMPQSKGKEIKEKESKENESENAKNFEWFLNQFDEIWVDYLKSVHKGKDFMQAAKESFAHLAADPARLKMAESHDCKKLLNTWLTNQKNNGKQVIKPSADKLASLINAKYGNKGADQ